MLPIQRMQVWSLVWKLRSHMLPSTAKEIKIKQKQKHFLKSDLGRLNDEKYISRDRASQSLYKRGGGKKAGHVSLDQRILEGRGCLTHHYFWDLEQHWPQEMFHEDPLAFLGEGLSPRGPEEALDLGSSLLFLEVHLLLWDGSSIPQPSQVPEDEQPLPRWEYVSLMTSKNPDVILFFY